FVQPDDPRLNGPFLCAYCPPVIDPDKQFPAPVTTHSRPSLREKGAYPLGDYNHEDNRFGDPGRSASPPSPTPERPAILVADHDATVRTLLQAALYRSGFAVYLAADGPEA